jgi:dTDP-4-dehydrorhamnose reductase
VPYTESDTTAPLGVYGATKLAGERAIAAVGCRHLILRTSWVYSLHGRNFLTTMHRLAGERDELRVVDDQRGSPTSSAQIAQASARTVARWLDEADPAHGRDGVYHMTCAGSTTWCGFARAIVARLAAVSQALGSPAPERSPTVTAIATADFPTPARRPANSVLDNGKLARVFGVKLPHWEAALDALMEGPPSRAGSRSP